MKERPILMSGAMVRAILDGSKTQTRRIVKPQPEHGIIPCAWVDTLWAELDAKGGCRCHMAPVRFPYGAPGDRLWVRETFAHHFGELRYRADESPDSYYYGAKGWKPSIFMPRALSRITLEITGVRVERVQDISEDDAWAEGVEPPMLHPDDPGNLDVARATFAALWDSINAARAPWESNPWVWVVEFKRFS